MQNQLVETIHGIINELTYELLDDIRNGNIVDYRGELMDDCDCCWSWGSTVRSSLFNRSRIIKINQWDLDNDNDTTEQDKNKWRIPQKYEKLMNKIYVFVTTNGLWRPISSDLTRDTSILIADDGDLKITITTNDGMWSYDHVQLEPLVSPYDNGWSDYVLYNSSQEL